MGAFFYAKLRSMDKKEKEIYLANIILVMKADNEYTPDEMEAFQAVCEEIGADESQVKNAVSAVENNTHQILPVKRFSLQIKNLEDMIYIALATGTFPESEKKIILTYAKAIGLSQKQINTILSETKNRFKREALPAFCSQCGKHMPDNSSFCPFCGQPQSG